MSKDIEKGIGDKLLDNGLPKLLDAIDMKASVDKLIPYTEKLFPKEKLNIKKSMWKKNVSKRVAYNHHINCITLNEFLSSVAAQYVIRCFKSDYINEVQTKRLKKHFLKVLQHHIGLHNEWWEYKTKGIKSRRIKIHLIEESKNE